jgi:hypothetical protein
LYPSLREITLTVSLTLCQSEVPLTSGAAVSVQTH